MSTRQTLLFVLFACVFAFGCASETAPHVEPLTPENVAVAVDPLLEVLDFCAREGGNAELIHGALSHLREGDRLTALTAAAVLLHNLSDSGHEVPLRVLEALGRAYR